MTVAVVVAVGWSGGCSEGRGVLVRLGAVRVGLGTDAVTDPSAVRVGLAVGSSEPSPPPPHALSATAATSNATCASSGRRRRDPGPPWMW